MRYDGLRFYGKMYGNRLQEGEYIQNFSFSINFDKTCLSKLNSVIGFELWNVVCKSKYLLGQSSIDKEYICWQKKCLSFDQIMGRQRLLFCGIVDGRWSRKSSLGDVSIIYFESVFQSAKYFCYEKDRKFKLTQKTPVCILPQIHCHLIHFLLLKFRKWWLLNWNVVRYNWVITWK